MEPSISVGKCELPQLADPDLDANALWKRLLSDLGPDKDGLQSAAGNGDGKDFVHIDERGNARMIDVDKHDFVKYLQVRYRDLLIVDPTLPLPNPSVILVRARAIVLNLDVGGGIRMVIAENQCWVLSVPKATDPRITALPTLDHPFIQRLCRCLGPAISSRSSYLGAGAGGGGAASFDYEMPFELKALEVALAAALGLLREEMDRFEEHAAPVVDALLHRVDTSVLEGVRGVKNGVDWLQTRVARIHQELEELLEDDADMADMYLGQRAAEQELPPLAYPWQWREREGEGEGEGEIFEEVQATQRQASRGPSETASLVVNPHDIEDCEDLLELFYVRTNLLLRRLRLLDERIDDVEDYVELQLDQRRNDIVSLNLVVSTVSMAFGWGALIAGIFGMNLINSQLDSTAWVFWVVIAVTVSVSVGLLLLVGWYVRKKKLLFVPDKL